MTPREAVLDAIAKVFPRFRGTVTDETVAADVPGWDSFTHVQLMFEIENRLTGEIEVSETYEIANVGSLIAYLEKTSG